MIKEPHEVAFIRFPAYGDIQKVPACTSYAGLVVKRSEDEQRNEQAAFLAQCLNGPEIQEVTVRQGMVYANRKSVNVVLDDPYWQQVNQIVQENGMMDLGLSTETYSAVRPKLYPRLQDMWNGKQTASEALAQYERDVNAILQEE